jgi:hypothetical protein
VGLGPIRTRFGEGTCPFRDPAARRSLHLILDNGSTLAPKHLIAWILSLGLLFPVHLHCLPVNASWLD